MSEKQTNYPYSVPPEKIEALIEDSADLQKQILRRYTQAVLEEMGYHLFIAQEKCKMWEEANLQLRTEIDELRNRINTQAAL